VDSRNEDRQSDIGSRKRSWASSEEKEYRYTVERIVDPDEYAGRKRYLIKWDGWPEEDMTWEPESNPDECKQLL
jgi:hypothetical protein